jgi:hypothetical protein
MSKSEWESAEIILPSVEISKLKKILNDSQNATRQAVIDEAKRFWKEVAKQTRSTKLYEQRLNDWREQAFESATPSYSYGGYYSTPSKPKLNDTDIYQLEYMLSKLSKSPRQLTVQEVEKVYPKAINRTVSWQFGEGGIRLEGRKLFYEVSENNHACDRAREHPLAQKLFAYLSKVNWTRGTGGVVVGNDEYNQDNRSSGGGANYTKDSFGPLGERDFEWRTGIKLNKQQIAARKRSSSGLGF